MAWHPYANANAILSKCNRNPKQCNVDRFVGHTTRQRKFTHTPPLLPHPPQLPRSALKTLSSPLSPYSSPLLSHSLHHMCRLRRQHKPLWRNRRGEDSILALTSTAPDLRCLLKTPQAHGHVHHNAPLMCGCRLPETWAMNVAQFLVAPPLE